MIKQRGFTLIEMAFVVAILGLMVGGGLFAIGPITLRAKLNSTNNALDQVEAALTLYTIRNNRLPCPADGALGASAVNYGVEQAPVTSAGAVTSCPVTTTNSVVPWITLGLDETYSADGWGRRISYFAANNTLSANVDALVDNTEQSLMVCDAGTGSACTGCMSRTYSSSSQTITKSTRETSCDPANLQKQTPSYPYGNYIPVYTFTASSTFVEVTGSQPLLATCPSTGGTDANLVAGNISCAGNRAAYVLISHGPSGWYGWNRSATATASRLLPPGGGGSYTLKPLNGSGTANGLGFIQQTSLNLGSQASATYFDDIVRWRSPAFIIQQCGSGACGNP